MEIEMTCKNCRYDYEDMEGTHCRHCIHNAQEKFEPKAEDLLFVDGFRGGYKVGCSNAIDKFVNVLIPRLTDAIYQKDVESMTNLINDVAKELKAGADYDY